MKSTAFKMVSPFKQKVFSKNSVVIQLVQKPSKQLQVLFKESAPDS